MLGFDRVAQTEIATYVVLPVAESDRTAPLQYNKLTKYDRERPRETER